MSYKSSSWLTHGRHSTWGLALSFLKVKAEDLALLPTLVVVCQEDEELKDSTLSALRVCVCLCLCLCLCLCVCVCVCVCVSVCPS